MSDDQYVLRSNSALGVVEVRASREANTIDRTVRGRREEYVTSYANAAGRGADIVMAQLAATIMESGAEGATDRYVNGIEDEGDYRIVALNEYRKADCEGFLLHAMARCGGLLGELVIFLRSRTRQ